MMTMNNTMNHRKRPFAARCIIIVLLALLLPFCHVQGLTPSKPPSRSSSNNNARNKKKNNLSSSVASSDMGRAAIRSSRNNAGNQKRTTVFHNKNKSSSSSPRKQRPQQQQQQQQQLVVSQTSIFVKNLHYGAQKSDICQACLEQYGQVKSVWIPRDNKSKGYAKVDFLHLQDAQAALTNGRLNVLGRQAFLSPDTRPVDDQGDAFRYLAAFSKGDFDKDRLELDTILQKVKKAGHPRSEKERGILAAALARIGAKDLLLKVFNWKNERSQTNGGASTSVYNSALSAMKVSTLQDCQLAQTLVAMAQEGPGTNARTYGTAIASIKRGCCDNNSNEDLSKAASEFLQTAIVQGVANHVVYNELISCLGKTGHWKMAVETLEQMFDDPNVEPTEVSLNSAIAACASAGQLKEATKIYQESFSRAKITPTIVTTNSLLSTAHKWIKKRRMSSGQVNPTDATLALDVCRSFLADASQRGDQLDVVSINTLVSAYGAAGDVPLALEVFRKACSKGVATTVTANAALSALALAGESKKAVELVKNLESSLGIKTDVTSWNTAISACGGDIETAMKLFQSMPHVPDAHSFVSVLSAFQDGSAGSTVHDLLERADRAKVTTTFVLNAALAALDRLGDFAAVQVLFEEGFSRRSLAPDVVSYNTAIHSLGRKDPSLALELFSGMLQEHSPVQADEQTHCSVIASLADSGMVKQALEIVNSSSLCQKSVAVYNEALRACYGAAEPESALGLLHQMKTEGPEPNLVSTTIVMNTCAKAGRHYEAAFGLFEGLESPDLIAFNSAISLAEKSGDANKAIRLLTRLVREIGAPDGVSFCSTITACERAMVPRFRAALRLLKESVKAVGPDAGCYIATVQTLAAAGQLDRALELLTHECVQDFDSQSKYVLYRTVQVGCSASGDSFNANRLSKEMKDHNLKALAPLAITRVGGCLENFDNKIDLSGGNYHHEEDSMAADVANTVHDLAQKMNHQFVTSALPIEFQASSTQKAQEISLANHAEKKALAKLLIDEKKNSSQGSSNMPSFAALSVEINFKMCADCHEFFKQASAYLERRITVKEPTMLHVFEDGECSCNDSWRWEARHAMPEGLKIPGLQQKVPAAAKHRFGRLPPRLKP